MLISFLMIIGCLRGWGSLQMLGTIFRQEGTVGLLVVIRFKTKEDPEQ